MLTKLKRTAIFIIAATVVSMHAWYTPVRAYDKPDEAAIRKNFPNYEPSDCILPDDANGNGDNGNNNGNNNSDENGGGNGNGDSNGGKNDPATIAAAFANVPEPWKSLILNTAKKYPSVDPRLVAATLWIENRGWPEYKTSGWATSSAGAKGPWQFIPSTWALMGTDGNGDGKKDPNDPADAVHAAFKHMLGSAGKPIVAGYNGNAEESFKQGVFQRDSKNLLSYAANYNGSGAPSGVKLSQLPRNQNSDYVKMAYWLLATNFTRAWMPGTNSFVDAKDTGAGAKGGESAPKTNPQQANPDGSPGEDICNDQNDPDNDGDGDIDDNDNGGGDQTNEVNSDGYAFPVDLGKNNVYNWYQWPCPRVCHHDGTPAFDLTKKPVSTHGGEGVAIIGIHKGKIQNKRNTYAGISGCQSVQFQGTDGWYYWYGHIQGVTKNNGAVVEAGQSFGHIGHNKCTGNGSPAHLHIDRGRPKGSYGGSVCCRDSSFVPLINKLWSEL